MGWHPSLALDPVAWRLTGEVEVLSEGVTLRYALVLDEVRAMHVERSVPLPWKYAELKAVQSSTSGDESDHWRRHRSHATGW